MPCCGINGQATIPNPSVSAFPLYHHPRTHTTQRRAAAAVVLEASKHAENERVTSIIYSGIISADAVNYDLTENCCFETASVYSLSRVYV